MIIIVIKTTNFDLFNLDLVLSTFALTPYFKNFTLVVILFVL